MLLCRAVFFFSKCLKKSLETKKNCVFLASGLLGASRRQLHRCPFRWRQSLLNTLGLSVLIMCMYRALENWPWGRHPGTTGTEIIRNGHNVAHFCLSCNRQSCGCSVGAQNLLQHSFYHVVCHWCFSEIFWTRLLNYKFLASLRCPLKILKGAVVLTEPHWRVGCKDKFFFPHSTWCACKFYSFP